MISFRHFLLLNYILSTRYIFQRQTNTQSLTSNTIFLMRNTSERLQTSGKSASNVPTLSLSEALAKILAQSGTERDCKGEKATLSDMQSKPLGVSDLTFLSGRMLRGYSSQDIARIFGALSKRLPTLAVIDLNGNCVIRHGFYPKTGSGCTLSDVLQTDVPQTYFLSLRRAECMVRSGVMNPLLVQVVR